MYIWTYYLPVTYYILTEVKDEYDDEFERMREANLRTRQVVAVDEYNDAKSMVEDCRAKLAEQKKQVRFFAAQWGSQDPSDSPPIHTCQLELGKKNFLTVIFRSHN